MITTATLVDPNELIAADLCIIGAGPAGLAVAERLLGTELRVVILESGGEVPDAVGTRLNGGEVVGYPYHALHTTRARALGGSSHLWDEWMRARPLDDSDFRHRPWVHESGWPIGLDDLIEHYRTANEALGLGPFDYEPDPSALPMVDGPLTEATFRYSNRVDYGPTRSRIEASASALLILGATVVRIETDPSGTSVEVVSATSGDGHFSVAARAFVIAAGGIESARLLLSGGDGAEGGIGNAHDQVGRRFMEHPRVRSGVVRGRLATEMAGRFNRRSACGASVRSAIVPSPDTMERDRILNGMVLLTPTTAAAASEERRSLAMVRDHLSGLPVSESAGMHALSLARHPVRAAGVATGHSGHWGEEPVLMLSFTVEQPPREESRVTLGEGLDEFGVPVPRLEWVVGEEERHTVRALQDHLDRWLGETGLGRLEGKLGDEPAQRVFFGEWHQMGTTRMSEDPRNGVVDRDLRVHGVENLWVVGASVFPTSGYANPTLTVVALAHRLTEHLKVVLSGGPALGPIW